LAGFVQANTVSIHAPARGATVQGAKTYEHQAVSIHAPARGATPLRAVRWLMHVVSIHAPARGATEPFNINWYQALFQSTRPRGARRSRLILIGIRHCFNPRARAGRDVQHAVAPDAANDVSIHAPARGATYFTPFWSSRIVSFNPRARAGRDHLIVKVNPLK